MYKKLFITLIASTTLFAGSENLSILSPDSQAPIGVNANYLYSADDLGMSFKFKTQENDDMYIGDKKSATDTRDLSSTKSTIGAAWGFSDDITFTATLPFKTSKMKRSAGSVESNGVGDLKINSIFNLEKDDNFQWLANAGVSLPIGDIKQKDGDLLPYAMQNGSGTFDILLGTSASFIVDKTFSLGGQLAGTVRTGQNKQKYALGNNLNLDFWGQASVTNEVSLSLRSSTFFSENIKGRDKDMDSFISDSSYSTKQGKRISDIGFGVAYQPNSNFLSGNRLALEYSVPVYKYTTSDQTVPESIISFGIQRVL